MAILISAMVMLIGPSNTDAKVLQGKLSTKRDFMYLAKFCYGKNGGSGTVTPHKVKPKADAADSKILLSFYNDQSSESWYWPKVYKSHDTCEQKVAHQWLPQSKSGFYIHENPLPFNFTPARRPHYWYLAVSDCTKADDVKLEMDLDFHFINRGVSSWYAEFSYEDQDLLTIYLVFAIIWFLGSFGAAYGAYLLFKREQFTFVVKLFDASIVFFVIALFLYLIHYGVYAGNGVGVPGFLVSADVLDMFTTLMFIATLLLVAKGAALDEIDLSSIKWDILVTTLLFILYIAFFGWQELFTYLKPQSNDYKWNSPPGITLLCLRVVFWIYFVFTIVRNFLNERQLERQYFLLVFGSIFSLWFLYLPFMVAVGEGIPAYDRWKTVLGISLSVQTLTYAFMCFLQWPSRLAKLFQLDVARLTPKVSAEDALEDTLSPYGTL